LQKNSGSSSFLVVSGIHNINTMNNTNTRSTQKALANAGHLVDRIHCVVVFLAMPTLVVFGITDNSLIIIVLYREGFKKSKNILLFSLAVYIFDVLFIIEANGPARIMYEWGQKGLWFPETDAHVLYYFYHIFDYLNWNAGPMSMDMPILITAERFIVVFFPLCFHTIVTKRKTLRAVIILMLLTYLPQIYIRFWFRFNYVHDPINNSSVGLSVRTPLYYNQEILSLIIGHFYAANGYFVFIVDTGSMAIRIRVSLAAAQRRRMMAWDNGKGGPSRTTKTLLTLCIFYTISCMFVAMPTFFLKFSVWLLFTENVNFRSMPLFMYHLIDLDLCLNASCNFVIYVAINKHLK
ncbi:hypothetical protein EGW08_012393, partial [Elysia chlorotica]